MKTNLSSAIGSSPEKPQGPRAIATSLKPDIVVVGGGMAGVMSALAAKGPDNRVLIIEPSNVLGGQGTAGGVAGFCGDTKNVNDDFQDLVGRLMRYGFIREFNPVEDRRSYDLEWCAFFLQEMVYERGIDVLLHSRMTGVTVEEGVVTAVDVSTAGGMCRVPTKFVIDATGACLVPAMAGFPVIHEGANRQLPMSLYFTLWDTRRPVKPFLPPSCTEWKRDDEIPMTTLHEFESGKVEVKMKVVGFDAADGLSFSQAEMHARRQMISLIYYLQTKGFRGVKLDRHVLATVSRQIGVRETRRIEGDHLLTEEDVTHGAVFDDAVAVGTYHLDYHWPDKMQRGDTGVTTMVEPYHIPLRAMRPKGALNLLVPGRGASGDQMAMSSFRVMAPVSQMGFAAGRAAQLCVREGCTLAGLDVVRLQASIEQGGQKLDLSQYGEYLRNGLLDHEDVFLGEGAWAPAVRPAIVHRRNNRFLVAWVVPAERHAEIWVADRFQCRWSSPRRVARTGADANALVWSGINDRTVVLTWRSEGKAWRASADEGGNTWSATEEFRPAAGREVLAAGNGAIRTLHDGAWLRIVMRDDAGLPCLRLAYSPDKGGTWPHVRVIEDGGIVDPVCLPTPRGAVLIYALPQGRLRFWHGSVEQIVDSSALQKYSEALHLGIMP